MWVASVAHTTCPIYVTDTFNHKVWVMTTTGEIVTSFGDDYLSKPEGITIDKAGFVYVTSHHSKIVVFQSDSYFNVIEVVLCPTIFKNYELLVHAITREKE